MRKSIIILALFASACGSSSPTAPSAAPLTLWLAGQSNAALLGPYLEAVTPTVGFGKSAAPIADFAATGADWQPFVSSVRDGVFLSVPLTTPDATYRAIGAGAPDAIVWWQGESDPTTTNYPGLLDDVVARMRAMAGNPNLLVVIMQLGAHFATGSAGADGVATWAQTRPHALWIETRDLAFQDDLTHMTPDGYTQVSARIVSRVRSVLH